MVEGRSCGQNNNTTEMDVARAIKLVNDIDLLCAAHPVGIAWAGRRIGFAFRKYALSGDPGAAKGMDVRWQCRLTGAHSLDPLSPRPCLPGGS